MCTLEAGKKAFAGRMLCMPDVNDVTKNYPRTPKMQFNTQKNYFLRPEKKVAFLILTVLRVSNPGNGMFFPLF